MTGTGRFRYRDESGEEHELASVEVLSRRVEEGALSPDTSLFDAGTGQWGRAGDLPVFQFIVDELRREGRLPEGFDSIDPGPAAPKSESKPESEPDAESSAPPPSESPPESEGTAPEAPEAPSEEDPVSAPDTLELEDEDTPIGSDLEELPLTPDPFEMHLPRTMQDAADEKDEPDDEDAASSDDGLDNSPLHEWMLSQSPRPERGPGDKPPPPTPPPTPPPAEDSPRRRLKGIEPLASQATGFEPTGPAPSLERETEDASDGSEWDTRSLDAGVAPAGEIRSRPPPPRRDGRSRSRHRLKDRRKGMIAGATALGGVILLIAVFMLTPGSDDLADPVRSTGPQAPSGVSDPLPELPPFPLPDGSIGWAPTADEAPESAEGRVAELLQEAVTSEFEWLLDSVRVAGALDVVPPAGWLGGRYLSGASDFDDVPAFWEGYTAYIGQLMEEDEALYLEAARRGWEALAQAGDLEEAGVEAPGGPNAFTAAMAERYAILAEARASRYERRLRVATAAEELHEFLVRNEGSIEYAPALGGGVSADPVLEAVPMNQETRRGLEAHLDRLFQALDETRRGVPPALGGLRTELFNRLREPV